MCNCKCGNPSRLSFKSWLSETWTDADNNHMGEPENLTKLKQHLTTKMRATDALAAQKNLGFRQELVRNLASDFGVDEKIANQAVNAWISSTMGL